MVHVGARHPTGYIKIGPALFPDVPAHLPHHLPKGSSMIASRNSVQRIIVISLTAAKWPPGAVLLLLGALIPSFGWSQEAGPPEFKHLQFRSIGPAGGGRVCRVS